MNTKVHAETLAGDPLKNIVIFPVRESHNCNHKRADGSDALYTYRDMNGAKRVCIICDYWEPCAGSLEN